MMPETTKVLQVLLYQRPIGTLTHLPGDKNLFLFDEDYVKKTSRPTLSLHFQDLFGHLITNVKMTQTRLPPFFSNLLPEGMFKDYLAQRANINPLHEFSLLWVLGRDLSGAMTLQSVDGDEPFPISEASQLKGKRKQALFRFSLAGMQMKFSAIEKGRQLTIPVNGVGGEWIVKLPHTAFLHVPENEFSMMELARRVGIDVPETALRSIQDVHGLPSEFEHLGNHVYTIKRFDRTEDGGRIHIEDFAQVFGVYPESKYKSASYRNIAEVIWRYVGQEGLIEFIRRFVFNALIGNGDMHLKNWSLIYPDKQKPALAPAYDFVSTILYLPEDQLAMNFAGSKDFGSLTLSQFKRFADKAQLPEILVLDTVQKTVQAFAEAWKMVKDLPLSEDVRKAIEKHLKAVPLWADKRY